MPKNNIVVDTAKAKCEINSFVNHLIEDYGFPSVVIEGLFVGVVADIRQQEIAELIVAAQQSEGEKEAK